MDSKDLYIETENFLFGRVSFLYMKIPVKWVIKPIPRHVEVNAWVEYNGIKWVSSGYIGILLIDDESKFIVPIHINVGRNIWGKSIEELLNKEVKHHKEIVEYRLYHDKIGYVIYRKRYKRHILIGDYIIETHIKYIINCRDTGRVIYIDVDVGENLSNIKELLDRYLETIIC